MRVVAFENAFHGRSLGSLSMTAKYREGFGPLVGPVQAATARTRLPAPVKRILVRLALRSVGRLRCDTSLLSNLGNITDPPRFGELPPVRMWFSPSAHMPRGLSVGAVSVGGEIDVLTGCQTITK